MTSLMRDTRGLVHKCPSLRGLHRWLALGAAPFLLLSALTGMVYRILRNVFKAPKESVSWLMDVHHMSVIGIQGVYPVVVGIILLLMIVSGLSMLNLLGLAPSSCRGWRPARHCIPPRWTCRSVHTFAAMCLFIPLSMTAGSGVLFCVLRQWFRLPKEEVKWLMVIHQGSYLGLPVLYVTIVGTGLILMVCSGLRLTSVCGRICGGEQPRIRYSLLDDDAFDASLPDTELDGLNFDDPSPFELQSASDSDRDL